ncbi:MAG: DUF427 domain-containing protein [Calditrichaeota bacterium]|nr:DUF427 domain-containing protein [Calditrichota bacterium]
MKAIWNDQILAESEDTIVIEGNHYFPPQSIHQAYFEANSNDSFCPWKGTAGYYDVIVDGKRNPDSAWYYADPKEAASEIKGYIAFWRGVQVTE